MRARRGPLVVVLLCVIFARITFLHAQPAADPVLGRAGTQFITEREFRERFELTPGLYRQGGQRLQAEKLRVFYSLTAEKLLAQEALARSLDRDSLYQEAITGVTKLLVRDELHRREIRQRVTVSPEDVRVGMTQALTQVHVCFIFTEQEQDAAFLRSRLKSGNDLISLVLDTSLGALRDTATILWGDADTTIEQAGYRLAPGEVSPVLRAGEGYYILTVLRRDRNPQLAALSHSALEERVRTTIRMRRERVREQAYLADLLRDQRAYSPPATFRRFAAHLDSVFRSSYKPQSTSLDRAMVERMKILERTSLRDTLIVAGTTSWTVSEVLDRLSRTGFTVSGDSVRGIAARLFTVFRYWSEQELLAQEGVRRGLDRSPEVQQQLVPWRDHYLAGMIRRTLHATVSIADADVYQLLVADSALPAVTEVQLRELRTEKLEDMERAVRLLEQGVPFPEVVRQCSPDPILRDRGGLTEFFPVTERRPWGEIAMGLDSGEVYGPIPDSTGAVLIQLAGKRNALSIADTAFASRLAQAKARLLRVRQQETVDRFLAQCAHRRGFELYADRLEQLSVTPLPMLSYRFLGFGGRMFQVPFVEEELEWLRTEPPEEVILP